MPNGDEGGLDPRLEQRLRDELDAVQPRFSSPRYLSARRLPVVLRAAPAVLVATVVAMVGLTAYAGSPNPAVVIDKVVNVIHPPAATPSPAETPTQQSQNPAPSETPEHHQSPEPSERPETSASPEPGESPEPSGSPEAHESPEPSGGGTSDGGTSGGATSDGGTSGGGTSDGGTSDSGSGH
jgi:eukaryotic-like serine/threonine-protein kinase